MFQQMKPQRQRGYEVRGATASTHSLRPNALIHTMGAFDDLHARCPVLELALPTTGAFDKSICNVTEVAEENQVWIFRPSAKRRCNRKFVSSFENTMAIRSSQRTPQAMMEFKELETSMGITHLVLLSRCAAPSILISQFVEIVSFSPPRGGFALFVPARYDHH